MRQLVNTDSYAVGAEAAQCWLFCGEEEIREELDRLDRGEAQELADFLEEIEADEEEVEDEASFWLGYQEGLESILEYRW
jgi:hypothetical protein